VSAPTPEERASRIFRFAEKIVATGYRRKKVPETYPSHCTFKPDGSITTKGMPEYAEGEIAAEIRAAQADALRRVADEAGRLSQLATDIGVAAAKDGCPIPSARFKAEALAAFADDLLAEADRVERNEA